MKTLISCIKAYIIPSTVIILTALYVGPNLEKASIQVDTSHRLVLSTDKRNHIDRVAVLKDFFGRFSSPLQEEAETFVAVADKYGMDYRLLPSIACMESSCGKFLIPNTYNPFGWGIYGKNYIAFESYDEAIDTVARGLKKNYIEKGLDTPEEIAPIYTPPRHTHWLAGVRYFYGKINEAETRM